VQTRAPLAAPFFKKYEDFNPISKLRATY